MFRKQLTLALAALVAVAACAPCVSAQSGRRAGRGLSARGLSGREVVRDGAAFKAEELESAAAESAGRGGFDVRSLNSGRSARVVYAEDGDKHPNKTDKIVGVVLLGYLIFWAWASANSDGYAPSGHGPWAGGPRLRR